MISTRKALQFAAGTGDRAIIAWSTSRRLLQVILNVAPQYFLAATEALYDIERVVDRAAR